MYPFTFVLSSSVLLYVENSRWIDLIDEYNVNGIPQLTFFDDKGVFQGFSLGVRKYSELNDIFLALIYNEELPSFTQLSNLSNLPLKTYSNQGNFNIIRESEAPRDHG